jgi:hypothetical protein
MSENRTVKGVEFNYSLCSNYKLLSINVTDPIDFQEAKNSNKVKMINVMPKKSLAVL